MFGDQTWGLGERGGKSANFRILERRREGRSLGTLDCDCFEGDMGQVPLFTNDFFFFVQT